MNHFNFFISRLAFLFALCSVLPRCGKDDPPDPQPFASVPFSKQITPGVIDEASGIADSKINPGYLWVEQDGGNTNDIFLLSDAGQVYKKINIRGAINRDWEDMALGNGPVAGTNYLYIADIGDNNRVYTECTIYRFPEPSAATDTVSSYDAIRFKYADGPRDAEALLLDNVTKDIYILVKHPAILEIYELKYPQNTSTTDTAIYRGSYLLNGVVSAAGSWAGDELLVKTYTNVYYWKRNNNESILQTLVRAPLNIGYRHEPQGEAVCFKNDNSGFYTLSERPANISSVNLEFYKRK